VAPVVRAEVIAREAGGAEIVAVGRTDREGRVLITDLKSPKIVLTAEKARYFTRTINGQRSDSIALDCSAAEDCSGVLFELGLGGIVTGMVHDELGEPVEYAVVTATPPGLEQSNRRRPVRSDIAREVSDDRGYFRLFGLKPGPYVLKTVRPSRGAMMPAAFEGEPVEIEVEEGGEIHGIRIAGRHPDNARSFAVSGNLAGVELSGDGIGFIHAQSQREAGPLGGGFIRGTSLRPDGSFVLPDMRPGRYAFS
jgi:hypothetical protein